MICEVTKSVVGVIIGWLLGLLTPFLAHTLLLRFRGPKLVYMCRHEETDTDIPGVRQLYVNIQVKNVKPRIARQCRGYLLKIEEMQGDKTTKTIFERCMQCIWEFDNGRDHFDIPRGANPCFNVVRYQDGTEGFSPRIRSCGGKELSLGPDADRFKKNGKHRFSGMVTADELEPVPFAFDAEWTGTWPPTVT